MTRRPPRHGLPVTRWFPATDRPACAGVYERDLPLAPMSYWNGTYWCHSAQTPANAHRLRGLKSTQQDLRWRGLAEEPSLAEGPQQ